MVALVEGQDPFEHPALENGQQALLHCPQLDDLRKTHRQFCHEVSHAFFAVKTTLTIPLAPFWMPAQRASLTAQAACERQAKLQKLKCSRHVLPELDINTLDAGGN